MRALVILTMIRYISDVPAFVVSLISLLIDLFIDNLTLMLFWFDEAIGLEVFTIFLSTECSLRKVPRFLGQS